MNKIILASASPRRKQILELANFKFIVSAPETDESYPPYLSPSQIAIHIAKNKALAVSNSFDKDYIILAADTIVVFNGKIMGKPKNKENAIQILEELSGNIHEVITGVCIHHKGKEHIFHEVTKVNFRAVSKSQIEYYVDTFQPYDKAGAYAIQEWIGAIAITSIQGDYYNVMGLPINKIFDILNRI